MSRKLIEVNIAPKLVKLARKKAKEMGKLKNSIRSGAGNVIGFLGELIFAEATGAKICNTYDYDAIIKGKTIDIKTKTCSSHPLLSYECSIASYNITQQCDFYVFVRILKNFKTGWILGKIKKKDFFNKARFRLKGEVDKNSDLGWTFKADCYNLPISELKPLKPKKK